MLDASGEARDVSCLDRSVSPTHSPGSWSQNRMTEHRHPNRSRFGLRRLSLRAVLFVLLLSVALFAAACASSGGQPGSAESREAALRQIAADYATNGDLQQAQARLDKLNLANPAQLLVSLAESDMVAGRAREEIEASARLAEMLGARSQKLTAYLSPTVAPAPTTAAGPTVLAATVEPPATETVAPPPTDAATATSVPPTATEAPAATAAASTSSPTPEPQNPRVIADSAVNLRGGPGKAYPVIGRLAAGQEVPIIGRNESGDWWQIEHGGAQQAWVAGTVIRVLGAIDTVAVAQNIPPVPTAAPRPTAAAQPTAAPVTQAPTGGPDFRVIERRLWTVEETGGYHAGTSVNCGWRRELHVKVVDAAGSPLNGVTIKAHLGDAKEEVVTGHKGVPGDAEFVLGGGQEVTVIRDVDGRNVTSDYVAGLSTTSADISRDDLKGAGYCTEDGTCDAFVRSNGCTGHHSWTVTFRRSY